MASERLATTSVTRPGADMNKRNWLADRWVVAIVAAAIMLIPVPWVLVKAFALAWLPVVMALGLILTGAWLLISMQIGAIGKSVREAAAYRKGSLIWFGKSAILAVIVGIGAAIVVATTYEHSWFSYTLLKSGGNWTYVLFGLLPVLAYAATIQRLLAKRKSLGWTIAFGVASLIAVWFWAGYATYQFNHVGV